MQELTAPDVKTFHPAGLLLLLGIFVVLGLIGFGGLGNVLVLLGYGYSLSDISSMLSNPTDYPELKTPLMIIQGITALGAFVIAPILFIRIFLKRKVGFFFQTHPQTGKAVLLIFFIMMTFMVVNSVVIEWNQNIDLPESLSWFEEKARATEDQLEELTKFLTEFDSFGHLLLGLLVIAVLPGIGEELLFRGLVQNIFYKWLKNPHISIVVSALLFSAFHNQFYGLLPRMLLGILFGYLYYWSGKLTFAMIAHFINNAFMLVMVYLYSSDLIKYDIQDDPGSPGAVTLIFFFILTAGLLYYFYQQFKKNKNGRLAKGI